MSKLPRSQSGDRVVKAFERLGYVLDHQKGSHMVLYSKEPTAATVDGAEDQMYQARSVAGAFKTEWNR